MSAVSISVPKSLYEAARSRGIDVESKIIDVLASEAKLDPREEAEIRLEAAERYVDEAEEYITRGDSIQACEKLYKAAEECIKALAKLADIPEYRRAAEEGRWWAHLLGRAAHRLSRQLKEPKIADAWSRAYDLHVWGFHEGKYTVEEAKDTLPSIRWLLSYMKSRLHP